jgi:hypothetical protein
MNEVSPARRVRRASVCIGAFVSLSCFALLAGCDLVDQWVGGYVSATFMFGTALIYAGACLAIFGIIAGLGHAVSAVLPEGASYQRWLTPGRRDAQRSLRFWVSASRHGAPGASAMR